MDRPATRMQHRCPENSRPLAHHHLRQIIQRIIRLRRRLFLHHHHRRPRLRFVRRMAQVVPNRFQISIRNYRRREGRHDRRISLTLRRPHLRNGQTLLRVPHRLRKIIPIRPHRHPLPTRRHQHLPLPRLRQKQII